MLVLKSSLTCPNRNLQSKPTVCCVDDSMEQSMQLLIRKRCLDFLTYGQKHGQESCLITAEVLFCGIKEMSDGEEGPRRREGFGQGL